MFAQESAPAAAKQQKEKTRHLIARNKLKIKIKRKKRRAHLHKFAWKFISSASIVSFSIFSPGFGIAFERLSRLGNVF